MLLIAALSASLALADTAGQVTVTDGDAIRIDAKRSMICGGFTPNTIKLGPPFTITQDEIDLAVDSLDQALDVIDEKFVKN